MEYIITPLRKTLILITCFGLSACFHDEPDVEPNLAFNNAYTQIVNVSNKTEIIISSQTDESTAYNSPGGISTAFDYLSEFFDGGLALDGYGSSDLVSGPIFSKPSNGANVNSPIQQKMFDVISQHTSNIDNNIVRQKISSRLAHSVEENNASTDNEMDFSQQEIDNLINDIFNTPTQDGNVYTYTLRSDLCEGDAECLSLINSFTMELIADTIETGVINFKISGAIITAFAYSPTLLSLEIFLEGIKELVALEGETINDATIPEIFSGSFKLTVELISETEVKIISSIPQAINIKGDMDGDPIEFTLASTSKLFAIAADSIQNTASLELGLGMLYAKYMGDDESNPSIQEFSLKALTALFELNNNDDTLVATNIGIGNEPFTLNIDDTNAGKIETSTFGFNIEGSSGEITLTSDFNLTYYILNVNGELSEDFEFASNSADPTLTGELSIMVPSGTVMVEVENDDFFIDITKIVSGGPFTITGSGYFDSDFTVNSGQCIESKDDVEAFADGTTITNC